MKVAIHTAELKLPTFFSELDEELFFMGLRLTMAVRSFMPRGQTLRLELIDGFRDDRFLIAFLRRFGMTTRQLELVPKKKAKKKSP